MAPRRLRLWAALSLLLLAAPAGAQGTKKCTGETWEALSLEFYGSRDAAPLVALRNRSTEPKCEAGRFVRYPLTIRHEVRLGQTVDAITSRFLQAPGGAALLRQRNKLPEGTEPNAGQVLEVPTELELAAGTRPEADVEALGPLVSLEVVRAYNGVEPGAPLTAGGTLYIPVFLEPKAKPTPPPVAKVEKPDPKVAPKVAAPAITTITASAAFTVVKGPGQVSLSGFSHRDHRALMSGFECAHCHVPPDDRPYAAIPDSGCAGCHVAIDRTESPRVDRLALTFPHDKHMAETGPLIEEGYSVDCTRCHALDDKTGEPRRVGHALCVQCHNQVEKKPAVDGDCEGCHALDETQDRLVLARAVLDSHFRDGPRMSGLNFAHAMHIETLGGDKEPTQATCDRCHAAARTAPDMDSIDAMGMAECLSCHRGLEREMKDQQVALDECKTCHVGLSAQLMPSFVTVAEKPLSHTPVFRRRHGPIAEKDEGVCRACHVELAGGLGRSCDACHNKTRPADHTARWREEPHGRSAVRRGTERCSTCHTRDRCADCHSIAPRDHFPRQTFMLRHGNSARVSVRRCQTCHLPQVDCARCHDVNNL